MFYFWTKTVRLRALQSHASADLTYHRLLWWKLDKGNFGYQRCFDKNTSGCQNRRQRQAILRRYIEVSKRQGPPRFDQSLDVPVRFSCGMAARCFQPGSYSRFAAGVCNCLLSVDKPILTWFPEVIPNLELTEVTMRNSPAWPSHTH